MRVLILTLLALSVLGVIPEVNSACDYTSCETPEVGDDFCKKSEEIFTCLQDKGVDNDECSETEKSAAKTLLATKKNVKCGVAGLASSLATVLAMLATAKLLSK